MLSTSHVLSYFHNNPVSYGINCPILQVGKLRSKEDVTFRGHTARKEMVESVPCPYPPGSLTSKPKCLTTGAFLSGQLSGCPASKKGPLCCIPSMWLLVCLPQAPSRFSALPLLPLPQDSPVETALVPPQDCPSRLSGPISQSLSPLPTWSPSLSMSQPVCVPLAGQSPELSPGRVWGSLSRGRIAGPFPDSGQ